MANVFYISEMVSLALHSILIIAAVKEGQLVNTKKIASLLGASAHLAKCFNN